jgi:DNA-binding MarR family transcriptional regulator
MSEEAVVRNLERIAVQSGRVTTQALADVHPEVRDLSVSQYRLFALVALAPDGRRVGDLARLAAARPQATTRLVQRLEAKGLLWSERGSLADRRAVVVRTTEAGARAWAEISVRRRELLSEILAGTMLQPETASVLELIAQALERAAGDGGPTPGSEQAPEASPDRRATETSSS